MKNKMYLCIDLKSFYASVECVERGLDPMTTNLVVADAKRTEKTICLAVSPSLKSYGVSGRARLFEVVEKVNKVNKERLMKSPNRKFTDESYNAVDLDKDPSLALTYITAPPRMAYYMEYSTRIYNIYLKYVSSDDIHVYSIDEVFIDITGYLKTYGKTPRDFAMMIIGDVLKTTGITATVGLGTNMYLAKIAMDIVAKHAEPDKDGVRIAELDEMSYRHKLWSHTPITDFWRVGSGYAKRLETVGIRTMGDIARCSLGGINDYYNEDLLYKMLGVNAELLIDHAWGYEPCTIADIREYIPENRSQGAGQVLHCPYDFNKARLIVREMTELLVLDLVDKGFVTDSITLTVGYDIENLTDPQIRKEYHGAVTTDHYGRRVPKHANGTVTLNEPTSSTKEIMRAVTELYDKTVNAKLLVRRVNITANNICEESKIIPKNSFKQMDLLTDPDVIKAEEKHREDLKKERSIQEAMINIKKQFGKNSIIKGMNLEDGATTLSRNGQIGGHKA